MRYLSIGIILFAMHLSWGYIHKPSLLAEATHVGIQEDLRRVITEYIEENLPSVQNIVFERFWTQNLKENQVKAFFSYRFDDENAEEGPAIIGVEGFAILNRMREPDSQYDLWSLDDLQILNNKITYRDGVTITDDSQE